MRFGSCSFESAATDRVIEAWCAHFHVTRVIQEFHSFAFVFLLEAKSVTVHSTWFWAGGGCPGCSGTAAGSCLCRNQKCCAQNVPPCTSPHGCLLNYWPGYCDAFLGCPKAPSEGAWMSQRTHQAHVR